MKSCCPQAPATSIGHNPPGSSPGEGVGVASGWPWRASWGGKPPCLLALPVAADRALSEALVHWGSVLDPRLPQWEEATARAWLASVGSRTCHDCAERGCSHPVEPSTRQGGQCQRHLWGLTGAGLAQPLLSWDCWVRQGALEDVPPPTVQAGAWLSCRGLWFLPSSTGAARKMRLQPGPLAAPALQPVLAGLVPLSPLGPGPLLAPTHRVRFCLSTAGTQSPRSAAASENTFGPQKALLVFSEGYFKPGGWFPPHLVEADARLSQPRSPGWVFKGRRLRRGQLLAVYGQP